MRILSDERSDAMFWFKHCQRCGGDLYHEEDMYGEYVFCLQCGHYIPQSEMMDLLTLGEPQRAQEMEAAVEPAMVA